MERKEDILRLEGLRDYLIGIFREECLATQNHYKEKGVEEIPEDEEQYHSMFKYIKGGYPSLDNLDLRLVTSSRATNGYSGHWLSMETVISLNDGYVPIVCEWDLDGRNIDKNHYMITFLKF